MEKKAPIPEDMVECLRTYFISKEFTDDLNALFEEVQQAEYSKNPTRAQEHASNSQPQYELQSVIQFFQNAIEDTDECKDIISKITPDQIKDSVKNELKDIRKAGNTDDTKEEMNKKEIVEIFRRMISKEFGSIIKEYFPDKVSANDDITKPADSTANRREEDKTGGMVEEDKEIPRMEDEKIIEPREEEKQPLQSLKEDTLPQTEPPKEEEKPQEQQTKEEKPSEEPPKEEEKPQEQLPTEEKPQEEPPKEDKPQEEPPKEEEKPQEQPPTEEKAQEEPPKEEEKPSEEPPKEETKPEEEPPKEEVKSQEEPSSQEEAPKEDSQPQEESKAESATNGISKYNNRRVRKATRGH